MFKPCLAHQVYAIPHGHYTAWRGAALHIGIAVRRFSDGRLVCICRNDADFGCGFAWTHTLWNKRQAAELAAKANADHWSSLASGKKLAS